MAKTLKQIVEERAQKAAEYRKIYDTIDKENRAATEAEDKDLTRLMGEIKDLDKQEERASFLEKEERRAADLDDLQRRSDNGGGSPKDKEIRSAFIQYLRDPDKLTSEQRSLLAECRAQTTENSKGGYLVSTHLGDRVIETMKSMGGFLQAVTLISTAKGGTLSFPTVDDTSNEAVIVDEMGDDTEGDVAFGTVAMGAYTYRSKAIPVSFELLQDSEFDIIGLLARLIADSIWRALNKHITIGDGTKKPEGVVACAKGADAAAAAITYDNLVKLRSSIDVAYRSGSSWMLNSNTEALLMMLKDTTGRPLWVPSLIEGTPDKILGHPVVINPFMPDVAAGTKSVVFGDLKQYMLREVKGVGVLRLNERFANKLAVGFIGYARYDGKCTNKNAIKHLLHANS